MDPACPPGWKADQKEFAEWSDDSSETSVTSSSTTSSNYTDLDDDSEGDDHVLPYGYFKVIQIKKVYKVLLEEEDLIQ
jgi:hypothetical protein